MAYKKKSFNYYLKEYGPYLAVIVIVLLIKQFLFSPVMVSGESMINTLKDSDIMIMDKISLNTNPIKRFEIVVITYQNRYLIKRVVGLPGEKIEYKDNKLYVNGEYVEEPFLDKEQVTNDISLKVPEGFYFVLGDNRVNSNDSRYLGCFSLEKIEGRTSFTIFPFSRFGKKE